MSPDEKVELKEQLTNVILVWAAMGERLPLEKKEELRALLHELDEHMGVALGSVFNFVQEMAALLPRRVAFLLLKQQGFFGGEE